MMKQFKYHGTIKKEKNGIIEARNEAEAKQKLWQMGFDELLVYEISKAKKKKDR